MPSMEEMAFSSVMNSLKVLSAVFDQNNGKIAVDKDIFINAEMRFYIMAETEGDKITFAKIDGQSPEYLAMKKAQQ